MFLSLRPAVEKRGMYGCLAGCCLNACNGQRWFCWMTASITRNLMEPEKDVCQDTYRPY